MICSPSVKYGRIPKVKGPALPFPADCSLHKSHRCWKPKAWIHTLFIVLLPSNVKDPPQWMALQRKSLLALSTVQFYTWQINTCSCESCAVCISCTVLEFSALFWHNCVVRHLGLFIPLVRHISSSTSCLCPPDSLFGCVSAASAILDPFIVSLIQV